MLSWQDDIVAPQTIQTFPGARKVLLHGLGDVSLVYDRRAGEPVLDVLHAGCPYPPDPNLTYVRRPD